MRALIHLAPLLAVLFFVVAKGDLRKFFLLGAIICIPFRTTYAFGTSSHQGWVDGVEFSISDIFFLLFAACTWVSGRVRPLSLKSDGIVSGFFLFACASLLSMINSTSQPMTMYQVILLFQVLIVGYLCTACYLADSSDIDTVLLALSLSLILQGVIGCAQFSLQQNFLLFSTGQGAGQTIVVGDEGGSSSIRVFGTLGKPNGYAMVLVPPLLINTVLLRYRQLKGRRLRFLSVFFGFLGLIFSGSRGGWLSCSSALLVYFGYAVWKLKGHRLRFIGGAAVLLVLFACFGGSFILQRLTSDDQNAAGSRVPLVWIAIEMIRTHPIVGIGANTYHNVMRHYITARFGDAWVGQVHNTYLLVFSEIGIFGILAFLRLARNLRNVATGCFRDGEGDFQRTLGFGLILVLVQVSVHMLVEAYVAKIALTSLLVLFGIGIASRKIDV